MKARGARSYAGFAPAELLLLLLLTGWTVVPVVHLVTHLHGGALSGADGPFPADQLQYLAWIRDSGNHLLAGDLFEIPPGARVFLHPMWLISGGLWRIGLPISLAAFIWKPIAVLIAVLGVRAYVARLLDAGAWRRTAVVALALCYISPLVIVYPAAARLGGEMFTAGQLWGYLPSVIAVGLMPVYLLTLERAVHAGRTTRGPLLTAACAGLLVGWIHPWEGETLVLTTLGLLVWARGRARLRIVLCLAAAALPLAVYLALGHFDPAWRLAEHGGNVTRAPLSELLAALGPLAAVAAIGIRRPGPETQERALILWPAASLLIYFALGPSSSAGHGLAGIAIPLAVLADRGLSRTVEGVRGLRLVASGSFRAAAVAALVLLLTVPGAVHVARSLLRTIGDGRSGQIVSPNERAALRFLDAQPGGGGVLAPLPISAAVPAFTGKPVWVGHPLWSPDFERRAVTAQRIVAGGEPSAVAVREIELSGARYVLGGCDTRSLTAVLAPVLSRTARFGCETVYVLR